MLVGYGWPSATDFSWYSFPTDWPAKRIFAAVMLVVVLLFLVIWPLAVLMRRRELIEIEGDQLWIGARSYPLSSLSGAEPAITFFGDSVRVRFSDGSSRRMNLSFSPDRPRDVAEHLNEIAAGANA
jgi:hypothetical protein